MCTSITARRHAAFQDGGAFVIVIDPEGWGEGRGRSGLGGRPGVKIRVLGYSGRCRCGRVSGVWDKEIFVGCWGIRLHGSRRDATEIPLVLLQPLHYNKGFGKQGLMMQEATSEEYPRQNK